MTVVFHYCLGTSNIYDITITFLLTEVSAIGSCCVDRITTGFVSCHTELRDRYTSISDEELLVTVEQFTSLCPMIGEKTVDGVQFWQTVLVIHCACPDTAIHNFTVNQDQRTDHVILMNTVYKVH